MGVKKLFQNLNSHKATGPDDIPARLLKETADETAPMFTTLFRASLQQGKLPIDWKTANVIKLNPKNYRPISLTCIVCKVMEHIISSNLMSHLEKITSSPKFSLASGKRDLAKHNKSIQYKT